MAHRDLVNSVSYCFCSNVVTTFYSIKPRLTSVIGAIVKPRLTDAATEGRRKRIRDGEEKMSAPPILGVGEIHWEQTCLVL